MPAKSCLVVVDKYVEKRLREKFEVVLPALNERQKRIYLAAEARWVGRGGVTAVARIAGVSREMIYAGLKELEFPGSLEDADEQIREEGGGRKKATETQPGLLDALNSLVDPESRGDPMSPLRWTCKRYSSARESIDREGLHC